MRISHITADGVLSFDRFTLRLDKRITVIVGPNGAGKSNICRVLQLVVLALQSADTGAADIAQALDRLVDAKRDPMPATGIEVRVGIASDDKFEENVLLSFLRATIESALARNTGHPMPDLENWVKSEVTLDAVKSLSVGEIVVRHPGTRDGSWHVGFEFEYDQTHAQPRPPAPRARYEWVLLGQHANTIVMVSPSMAPTYQTDQLRDRILGVPLGSNTPAASVPVGPFLLANILPNQHKTVAVGLIDLARSQPLIGMREFAKAAGIQLPVSPPRGNFGLARVFTTFFHHGFVQLSDMRLSPLPRTDGVADGGRFRTEPEGNLGERVLALKNGGQQEQAHWDNVRRLFHQFSGRRELDVAINMAGSGTKGDSGLLVKPIVLVSRDPLDHNSQTQYAQVPIEFAGTGASEALSLALTLGSQPSSVVALDEPAVSLHPSLQRMVKNELQQAQAQFLVITHSPYMVPVGGHLDDIGILRLSRDSNSATQVAALANQLLEACAPKLLQKGSQGIFFASAVILCEGHLDRVAIGTLAKRTTIDLEASNVFLCECGSRSSLPDYIRLCQEMELPFLVVADADRTTADKNQGTAREAQKVRSLVTVRGHGILFEFPENLETSLNCCKKEESIIEATELVDLNNEASDMGRLKQTLRQFVGAL